MTFYLLLFSLFWLYWTFLYYSFQHTIRTNDYICCQIICANKYLYCVRGLLVAKKLKIQPEVATAKRRDVTKSREGREPLVEPWSICCLFFSLWVSFHLFIADQPFPCSWGHPLTVSMVILTTWTVPIWKSWGRILIDLVQIKNHLSEQPFPTRVMHSLKRRFGNLWEHFWLPQ